jgi:hypothetical protein
MTAAGHAHDFGIPAGFADPLGRPVDSRLLGEFIGAAFDGCAGCQDALLTVITGDPATTARLVELACVATHDALGGLPASLTDETAPGMAGPEFRALAHAGLDGENDAMFALCASMTVAQRRAAADTAADILVGHLIAPPGGTGNWRPES